jgi:MFS family permease
MFVVARAILGFSAGFWGSTAPVLISGIAFPSHREVATGCYQCGFSVGGTVAAFVTFGSLYLESDWSWRTPSLFQVFLPLVLLQGVFAAPQSPRWLISKGRHEEARQTIAKWHAGGDLSAPIVAQELREIEQVISMESSVANNASYLDLVKRPREPQTAVRIADPGACSRSGAATVWPRTT